MGKEALIEAVAGVSLITPDRLQNLVAAVERTAHLEGDMAELGVYRGGSAKVIASVCPSKRLYLFDTFTGLPFDETFERDPDRHCNRGRFAADESEARSFLVGLNVAFYPGFFPLSAIGLPDAGNGIGDVSFSFVHVDCDLYSSAKDAIWFFWPRMVNGGIMFFDDYGCKFTGVTEALDEWFGPELTEKQYDYLGNQIGALVVKPLGGG